MILERGKWREKEGEKHQSAASHKRPNQGPNLHLKHVPQPGVKPVAFQFTG